MAQAARTILPHHVRRKRASFVLTSLIDVIFLLVIFFMVSSQIVPFSVIGLGPIRNGAEQGAAGRPGAAPIALRVMAGKVKLGGATIALADIGATLARLRADGVTGLLLIPSATATVQDIVTVLEAVKSAEIENVTVLSRRGAQQ